MRFVPLLAVAVFAATPALDAHGGNYRGGTYRGPGDTTGGSSSGPRTGGSSGPTTPGPGGPTTPGPATPSAPTPSTGPVTPPGGGPRTGPTTGGPRGVQLGPDLASWTLWWELNKDPFLELKSALFAAPITTGSDDFHMGRGLRVGSGDRLRPSAHDVTDVILPALRRALEAPGATRDILSSCAIALARIGHDAADLDRILPLLKSADQEVRESAALALGIFGHEDACEPLLRLATNQQVRDLTGHGKVDFRTQAFACYGLGLTLRRSSNPVLVERTWNAMRALCEGGRSVRTDVAIAALHAMRLLPNEGPAAKLAHDAIPFLEKFIGDAKHPIVVRAHGVTTLADVAAHTKGDRARVARVILGLLTKRRVRPWVAQSAALALGRIASPETKSVADGLATYVDEGRDPVARNFCAIALGQIGGARARDALLRRLSSRRIATFRKPWLGLGLAILDRGRRAAGANEPDVTIGDAILHRFETTKNPEAAAGFAIALGLMRYTAAGDAILDRMLANRRKDQLAGYCAVALGMMRYGHATEDIRRLLNDGLRREGLVTQCTIALGLLGDREVAIELSQRLRRSNDIVAVRSAIASGLGWIGDRRTLAPLTSLLGDRKAKNLPRAFAAVALGLIADKDDLPWYTPIAAGINYRARVESLSNGISGILDIL